MHPAEIYLKKKGNNACMQADPRRAEILPAATMTVHGPCGMMRRRRKTGEEEAIATSMDELNRSCKVMHALGKLASEADKTSE